VDILGRKADLFPWSALLAFFEEGQDGRVQPLFKKSSRLAKRKNSAFPHKKAPRVMQGAFL
jgi:hypothetical protein